MAPPIGGNSIVEIPATYEVFVNYPGPADSKTNPYAGNQTVKLSLAQYTGNFIVTSATTPDSRDSVANITQTFQNLVPDEIHISNAAGFGVWSHITRGGTDVWW